MTLSKSERRRQNQKRNRLLRWARIRLGLYNAKVEVVARAAAASLGARMIGKGKDADHAMIAHYLKVRGGF